METRLPSTRDEAWRWADLRHAEALKDVPAPANDLLPDLAALRIAPDAELALLVGGRAVEGSGLEAAPDRSQPAHPLADFAAAVAHAGLVRTLAPGTDGGTIEFVHAGTGGAAHSASTIRLEAGARLTLVETLTGTGTDHWLNHRLDVTLAENAQLVRVLLVPQGRGLVSERLSARLAAGAAIETVTLAAAAGAVRTETRITLEGTGASARVDGVLLGAESGALDAVTRLSHLVPGTTSQQTFRLVATDTAQVSIAGGVAVARAAQKTDAEQSLRALVLKRTAAANLKPELEILADDVRCAHGCAVGELDTAARFYLMSRGIDRASADALLTRAFLSAALAAAPQALAPMLEARIGAWLEARA
jgi:Fe-S cluster assembly protein SufD